MSSDSCRRKHDRPGDGESAATSASSESSTRVRAISRFARHQRKRFFFAIFAISQSRDGCGIPSIAGQVISAESFDRENLAGTQAISAAWRMLSSLSLVRSHRAGEDNNPDRKLDRPRAAHENGGCVDREYSAAQ